LEAKLSRIIAILLTALMIQPALSWEEAKGTICVAPVPKTVNGMRGAGPDSVSCAEDKYSLKIDSRQPIQWPVKGSIKIADLDPQARHRVVVLCGGKARQSFTFRISEDEKLCLFFNDLYWTVQLWPAKESPWCKCR
jgi:hypothetical protein